MSHPITAGGGGNIAYETHVYNAQADFASLFGNAAKTLPVIIGEFGPAEGYMTLDDCTALMSQARNAGIPHLGWTFHRRCPPNMLVDNSSGGCGIGMPLQPTPWGRLVQQGLAAAWG